MIHLLGRPTDASSKLGLARHDHPELLVSKPRVRVLFRVEPENRVGNDLGIEAELLVFDLCAA